MSKATTASSARARPANRAEAARLKSIDGPPQVLDRDRSSILRMLEQLSESGVRELHQLIDRVDHTDRAVEAADRNTRGLVRAEASVVRVETGAADVMGRTQMLLDQAGHNADVSRTICELLTGNPAAYPESRPEPGEPVGFMPRLERNLNSLAHQLAVTSAALEVIVGRLRE